MDELFIIAKIMVLINLCYLIMVIAEKVRKYKGKTHLGEWKK